MEGIDVAPARGPDVIWRKMGEEMVLLNVKNENYYSLNEVGSRVWELIDGQATPDQIASRVAEEYDAPEEQVESDVMELLRDLRLQELVT